MKCSTMNVEGKGLICMLIDVKEERLGMSVQMGTPDVWGGGNKGSLGGKDRCWAGTSLIMYSTVV